MDRSYPYSRRVARRAQRRRPLAAVVLLGLAGCTVALALTFGPDPISAASTQAAPQAAPLALAPAQGKPAPRRVYPYSVVPGGVASQAELGRIVRTDKVVAAHYATFDVRQAHTVTVDKPRAVHVSYRKGDKVYWTAKKVMLHEGETLLSDGKNEMRTRCANRVSDVAQFPVEAHEPSAELLETSFELPDAEDGSLQTAAASVAGDDAAPGQLPQLEALPNASASQGASTSVTRTASAGLGSMPSLASRIGLMTLSQPGSSARPGVQPQADDMASSGGVSAAPALVVATEVTQSNDAVPQTPGATGSPGSTGADTPSSPSAENAGAAPLALPVVVSESVATQPGGAGTSRPGDAWLATAGDGNPKPTEVPEPGTLSLVALALASMLALRKRR